VLAFSLRPLLGGNRRSSRRCRAAALAEHGAWLPGRRWWARKPPCIMSDFHVAGGIHDHALTLLAQWMLQS
jgi:hypothetical protein